MQKFYNDKLAIESFDVDIYKAIIKEEVRQMKGMELIASENYVSPAVLQALGSVLTNKYAEGYPGKRYYGGCEFVDIVEKIAIERLLKLFPGAKYANVQPHSGAPANIIVYLALMNHGDTILGMDLSHGGHLTHGNPVTAMAKNFNFVRYKMKDVDTGEIDYNELREVALKEKPKIILAGFSAYPRELDYKKFKDIADEVGAITMMDMAHIAGLIAGKQLKNPFDYGFDIVTSTTHKTLRGPRGGVILCRKRKHIKEINKMTFPGFQGGPHMHTIAAKAVAFKEALLPNFEDYAKNVIINAKTMANVFSKNNVRMITGGTDNHLILLDALNSWGLSGGEVEKVLDKVNITVNKNMIANDTRPALDPSGVRIGTAAMTTRGFGKNEFTKVADFIIRAIKNIKNENKLLEIKEEVVELNKKFLVPGLKKI